MTHNGFGGLAQVVWCFSRVAAVKLLLAFWAGAPNLLSAKRSTNLGQQLSPLHCFDMFWSHFCQFLSPKGPDVGSCGRTKALALLKFSKDANAAALPQSWISFIVASFQPIREKTWTYRFSHLLLLQCRLSSCTFAVAASWFQASNHRYFPPNHPSCQLLPAPFSALLAQFSCSSNST